MLECESNPAKEDVKSTHGQYFVPPCTKVVHNMCNIYLNSLRYSVKSATDWKVVFTSFKTAATEMPRCPPCTKCSSLSK